MESDHEIIFMGFLPLLLIQERQLSVAQKNVHKILGPAVQSVVSLTSSLKVISLTVLTDSIYNILICAKATHIFSAKNFRIFAYHSL